MLIADFGFGSKDEKTLASSNNDIGFIVDKVVLTDPDKKFESSFLKQIYIKNLVTVAFSNWKKALEVYRVHSNLKYHTSSVLDSEQFLKIIENNETSIIERLDKNRALQIEENRKRIKPIIECIILCGKEELALRGSKDFGPINVDGHFRALLKYRAKGDDFLRTVLEGSGKRNKYTSPVIQNEIVQACNTILLRKYLFYGYDGASNMAGQFKGVQTLVRSKYLKALYVHCAAHSLNLAVSTASGIKPIRNCLGLIEKAYMFFNTPKRNSVLLHVIENSDDEPSTKQLKRLCAIHWI
ncbi:52 kDa repressor of the inhibitor of the protein kinase-like [Aphis craccivora]|uniref:52 kDa repressor of the inhibitor of the protein kinase-like n=1 Tax=Aphis craccivora TaxID=307492 RepID=A0A6G0Y952_APHCR|nr:52 kDa repressor of the inhibitor of the protein kinase-like [Aphis craccivora]